MTIKVGDRLPQASFMTFTADGPAPVSADDLFKGKTVALFAAHYADTLLAQAPGLVASVTAGDKDLKAMTAEMLG